MLLTLGLFGLWALLDFVVVITGNFQDTKGRKIKA